MSLTILSATAAPPCCPGRPTARRRCCSRHCGCGGDQRWGERRAVSGWGPTSPPTTAVPAAAAPTRGRHRELIGELKALVTIHPLHEWLYSRLMLALHMSGRRFEALEVYQSLRRGLREEFGLDPSTELQQMQRALLSGSVAGYR